MTGTNKLAIKRLLLIVLAVVVVVAISQVYINSPALLLSINPENKILLTAVDYPLFAYRSENLPITVYLSNIGDAKDILIEVVSISNPTISNNFHVGGGTIKDNVTVLLPLQTAGKQAFSVKVTWIGPGGFCKISQCSVDKPFEVLAADYESTSPSVIASRAQGFDWTLSVTNTGNTQANLTIQLSRKDPLILSDSSGGTRYISNFQVGETRLVGFHFDVPHDADLGDHSITVSFVTNYPNIDYYYDCKETNQQNFSYSIQESTIKTQLDNSGYILTAVVALVLIIGGGTIMTGKRRGG